MKNIIGIVILLVTGTLFSFQVLKDQGGIDSSWKSFENDEYAIKYPGDWTVEEKKSGIVKFWIKSEMLTLKDKFLENVNLVKESVDEGTTIEKYYSRSLSGIKMLYDPKIYSESSGKNKDVKFKQLTYYTKIAKIKMVLCQRMFVHNQQAYVLTFSMSKKSYKEYKVICDNILNSFVLK